MRRLREAGCGIGLASTLCAATLGGCGGARAQNEYLSPTYNVVDQNTLVAGGGIPTAVEGDVPGIAPEALRRAVGAAMNTPAGSIAMAPSGGADPPAAAPRRTVWRFTGAPAPGGGTVITAHADYYRGGALASSAEGRDVVTAGAVEPQLRDLVTAVTDQLFPPIRRTGGSHP